MRKPQEANLSWVVEFYSNYHSPSLQSIFVRRKQVPISEEAIQRVLQILPLADGRDSYQEALSHHCIYDLDWDAILRVIAEPGAFWTQGRMRPRPKCIHARFLTVKARAWAQILSHYVLPSTHESSVTMDLALLVWCILTERTVKIPLLIRQALGRVQDKGNLLFPALVFDLVTAASVPREANDTIAIISVKGNVVPTGKYLRPPMEPRNFAMAT
ncbi:hypothetical protein AHAS_Ahas01G0171900 [Arachis hypogaea]